jgi:hypothetical protein
VAVCSGGSRLTPTSRTNCDTEEDFLLPLPNGTGRCSNRKNILRTDWKPGHGIPSRTTFQEDLTEFVNKTVIGS